MVYLKQVEIINKQWVCNVQCTWHLAYIAIILTERWRDLASSGNKRQMDGINGVIEQKWLPFRMSECLRVSVPATIKQMHVLNSECFIGPFIRLSLVKLQCASYLSNFCFIPFFLSYVSFVCMCVVHILYLKLYMSTQVVKTWQLKSHECVCNV